MAYDWTIARDSGVVMAHTRASLGFGDQTRHRSLKYLIEVALVCRQVRRLLVNFGQFEDTLDLLVHFQDGNGRTYLVFLPMNPVEDVTLGSRLPPRPVRMVFIRREIIM